MSEQTKQKALLRVQQAMSNPMETIGTLEGVTEYMGALNMLLYGKSPFQPHKQSANQKCSVFECSEDATDKVFINENPEEDTTGHYEWYCGHHSEAILNEE